MFYLRVSVVLDAGFHGEPNIRYPIIRDNVVIRLVPHHALRGSLLLDKGRFAQCRTRWLVWSGGIVGIGATVDERRLAWNPPRA